MHHEDLLKEEQGVLRSLNKGHQEKDHIRSKSYYLQEQCLTQ